MMDNEIMSAKKHGCTIENLDLQKFRTEDTESGEKDYFSKSLVLGVKPENILIFDVEKSKFREFCIQKLCLQRIWRTMQRMPRQITSLDELYFHQCLESNNISSLRAASLNNLSNIDVLLDSFSSRLIFNGSVHDSPFIFALNENVSMGPTGDSVLGTIMESTSMMNILKIPLFLQLGDSDNEVNFVKTDLEDFREIINSPAISSSGNICFWPPHKKQEKDRGIPGNIKIGFRNAHKRLVSISSSTNSTFSSESSSCTSTSFSQGMLHCSWNNGFPHYEFTVDRRETYIANLSKVESSVVKVSDYVYTFYSKSGGKKGDASHEKILELVGKMRVFTSFTICPNNMEIMETQFVLSASSDNFLAQMQTVGEKLIKNKGLSKHQSNKQRKSSKFGGSNAIPEKSREPSENSSSVVSTNLELAVIIVKNHIQEDHSKKVEIGGWGMKFLKSKGNSQPDIFPEATLSCEYCRQNSDEHCPTSIEVLIPAGFHGGPRTSNGGPSSLIERWINGQCDCGGWDIGCPLTVLKTKPSNKDVLPQVDVPGINSFDLFVQGSKQNAVMVKIMSIQDGLYYVQYQSTLSALQSLSIAVAIIHSRSPTLRPNCIEVRAC